MNLLVNLLGRILSGERLERGTKKDAARWLAALAAFPPACFGFAVIPAWIESVSSLSFDSPISFVILAVVAGLLVIWVVSILAHKFSRKPLWLIPIAAATWGFGAWLLLNVFT